jgi:hyperosmotically inducible protein
MKFCLAFLIFLTISCNSQRPDSDIDHDLTKIISTSYPGVICTVKEGVVTLSGTCPDESCKNSSESAAKSIKGVKNVTNEIVIASPH